MQPEERELALRQLAESRERLIQTVDGLSSEQLGFRPAEDRWSVADCVEHITVVESLVFNRVQAAAEAPPPAGQPPDLRANDDMLIKTVPSREFRVQGPPPLMPNGRWPEFAESMRQFEATRGRTVRFVQETEADLRSRVFPHPILGDADCYQWLLLIAGHCERHVRQLEEVKADAGFPRGAGASA
jgi:hypothetical protein